MNLLVELIRSILNMPGEFAVVATHDPLSALLMAFGGLFVLVSVGYFGVLAFGAAANFVTGGPDAESREPTR
ncbi:MAG: hypothetical protein ACI9HI_000507 [Salinirussus sp.]|jgi:hypothetical protein